MSGNIDVMVLIVSLAAIVVAVAGLAGPWWGLLTAGVIGVVSAVTVVP